MKVPHHFSLELDVKSTRRHTEGAARLRLLENTPVEELRPGELCRGPSVPSDQLSGKVELDFPLAFTLDFTNDFLSG